MRRMRLWLGVGALALGVLCATPALAQDANEARAREHFEIGRRYYDMGRFAEAAREFEQAYELAARPALLMNIYLAYRDAADPVNAARALRAYLETDEVDPAQRPTLEVRLEALERQAAEQANTTSTTSASASSEPDIVPPVILMAGGGALLLAGVGTGIATIAEHSSLEEACPNMRCSSEEIGRTDTVQGLSIATDVLLAIGVAAAAAGVVWLLVSLSEGGGDEAPTAELGCTGTGCFVRGAF